MKIALTPMTQLNRTFAFIVAVFALSASQTISAQDAPLTPQPLATAPRCDLDPVMDAIDVRIQIAARINRGCFTVQRLTSDFALRVRQELDKAAGRLGDERRIAIVTALQVVHDDASSHQETAPDEWKAFYNLALQEIRVEQGLVAGPGGRPEYWTVINHRTFQAEDGSFALNYAPAVDSCDSESTCTGAATEAVVLNTYLGLAQQILRYEARPRVAGFAASLALRKAQWDYYFDEARSQYWWELAVNSRRYKASDGELAEPPGGQLILGHPSVAFEYVGGGARNESAYDGVVVVEVAGYNKFGWRNSQPLKRPLGGSLVVTYTPDNTGDRAGIGVMLHVNNNWSIGATRRDTGAGSETTWLLSADLMKRLLRKSPETRAGVMCNAENDCQQ